MIIPVVAAVLLLLPGLLGGRLSRLATLRLQRTGWLLAALVAQFAVLQFFPSPGPVLRPVLPPRPIGCPALTTCSGFTSILLRCP